MKFVSRGSLRPTAGKIVEALFAILRPHLDGCRFLDLYAGVGSVGLEAWRCGAAHVVMVEKSPQTMRVLRENVRTEGAEADIATLTRDAVAALRTLEGQTFGLIFLDPPYGQGEVGRCLEALVQTSLLATGGLIIAEHHHKDAVPETVGRLARVRTQKYGETLLSFYRQDEGPSS